MPLNTVIAFMLFNNVLTTLSRPIPSYTAAMRFLSAYWQAIVVLIFLLMATGVMWQQTKQDIARGVESTTDEAFIKVQNTISSRLSSYADSLNGFRGLFAASNDV